MSDEIATRIARSARYRDVDPALVNRLVAEEAARGGTATDVTKRVKRRLHQAVGAFRGAAATERIMAPIRAAWSGNLADDAFRAECRAALARHASTRERLADLETLYTLVWRRIGGSPRSILDLGCGLSPLALPWMGLARDARYHAVDADARPLATVDAFLGLVGQPHTVLAADLAGTLPPLAAADVALLLKLVPTLDRQEPAAAARLVRSLRSRHAVISFPRRSLGGRSKGLERPYRSRLEALMAEVGASEVAETTVASELVFIVDLTHG